MGLPVQKVPEYFCELPLSGLRVKFRPFLVGEQKSLLLMQESEEQELVFDTVQTLIKEVTFGDVKNVSKLPMADLEYLFLQIRMKSIGESADMNLICQQDKCGASNPISLDLNDVKLDTSNLPDKKIELSEDLGVIMRYPTADLQKYADADESDAFIAILKSSIETIYDAEETYDTIDYADREMDEFLNSLSLQQVEKMGEFLNNTPTLSHIVKYRCIKCSKENSILLKGLENFF